eukprot:snap_masked-scaffold_10-processed-gene-11.37-mRNA-1 protein AED:1.00 eAED:1.00 QI:0/0/0/0/1/1/2/0/60
MFTSSQTLTMNYIPYKMFHYGFNIPLQFPNVSCSSVFADKRFSLYFEYRIQYLKEKTIVS